MTFGKINSLSYCSNDVYFVFEKSNDPILNCNAVQCKIITIPVLITVCHENVETLITHLIILLSDKCKKKLKKQINNLVYRLPLELLDFCRYLETDNVLFLRTPPSRNSKKKKLAQIKRQIFTESKHAYLSVPRLPCV